MNITNKQIKNTVIMVTTFIVVLICLVLTKDNTERFQKKLEEIRELNSGNLAIESYMDLGLLLSELDLNKEYNIVSDKDNNQADLKLQTFGLNVDNLISYAIAANYDNEGEYCVGILKVKDEKHTESLKGLVEYIGAKQQLLSNSQIAKQALVYEYNNYLMIVMSEGSEELLNQMLYKLVNKEREAIAS